MSEQYLYSSKIVGGLIGQDCLGTAERMCPVFLRAQSNRRNPFIDQSRALSGAEVTAAVNSAWEGVVVDTATTSFEPREQTCPRACGDLELDRPTGLLLDHH